MVTLQFLGGLALLIAGAELLVRGASRLAAAVGLSPLVIGLTVVAFGTSAPELAVSVKASVSGQADVALGNVVGSNTFNVLAILGVASLIAPLAVSSQLVRLDVPVMVVASVLAWWLASDGVVSRADGVLLASLFAAYTVALLRVGKQEPPALERQVTGQPGARQAMLRAVAAAVVGLGMLVVGARLLVDAAVAMATAAGVSEVLIGLTIVAAGTSLPEVVTSVVASLRGERDIAVGNVVGSNLFNLLCVLGVAGMASPAGVPVAPGVLRFDLPVMTAAAALCLPIFFSRFTIDRWEGAVLLGLYVAYVGWLASSM